MAYDDILLYLGEFGPYQRRIYLLLCLPAIVCALHKLGGVFLMAKAQNRSVVFPPLPPPHHLLQNVRVG